MPTTKVSRQRQAVADYLALLNKPADLIDWSKVEAVRAILEATEDPVERLRFRAEMEALSRPDRDGLEAAFVQHAKGWADRHGVGVEAFIAEGVEPKVLRSAGFHVPRKRREQ